MLDREAGSVSSSLQITPSNVAQCKYFAPFVSRDQPHSKTNQLDFDHWYVIFMALFHIQSHSMASVGHQCLPDQGGMCTVQQVTYQGHDESFPL